MMAAAFLAPGERPPSQAAGGAAADSVWDVDVRACFVEGAGAELLAVVDASTDVAGSSSMVFAADRDGAMAGGALGSGGGEADDTDGEEVGVGCAVTRGQRMKAPAPMTAAAATKTPMPPRFF
jgi:hypothetical protein